MTRTDKPPTRGDDSVALGLRGPQAGDEQRASISAHAAVLGARVVEMRSVGEWPGLAQATEALTELLLHHNAGLLVVDGLRHFVTPELDEHAIGHVLRWTAWSAGARLETCDGSDAIPDGIPCVICEDVVPAVPGLAGRLCQRCVQEAVDPEGRPVRFLNRPDGGVRTVLWADQDVDLIGVVVSVRGCPCVARPGRFGGVIVTTSPD